MKISDIITIKWAGFRKDANKGSFCGWFVLKGCIEEPRSSWHERELGAPSCFKFQGKVGKSVVIERVDLTREFLEEMSVWQKNYREIPAEQLIRKLDTNTCSEIEMFISMGLLRGDFEKDYPPPPFSW